MRLQMVMFNPALLQLTCSEHSTTVWTLTDVLRQVATDRAAWAKNIHTSQSRTSTKLTSRKVIGNVEGLANSQRKENDPCRVHRDLKLFSCGDFLYHDM
jgi:hypothetical protein